jgi:hypothetical protein
MHSVIDLKSQTDMASAAERLLWEDEFVFRGASPGRDALRFRWRAGSNSSAGAEQGVLRWRSGDGAHYAILSSPCGSVVWMTAAFPVLADVLNISFDARDMTGGECCVPIVYVGHHEPNFPAFFESVNDPIANDWRAFRFTVEMPRPSVPPPAFGAGAVIAIGFADPSSERAEVPAGHQIGLANIVVGRA